MALNKLVVKQSPEKEIPTEIIADSIVAISDGIKKLRGGRLNDRALVLLIQDACPSKRVRGSYVRVSATEVKSVLSGIESLASTFLRKKP